MRKVSKVGLKYSVIGLVTGAAEVAAGIAIGRKVTEVTDNRIIGTAAGVGSCMVITGTVNSIIEPKMKDEINAAVQEDLANMKFADELIG